jgi:hypothetical protein
MGENYHLEKSINGQRAESPFSTRTKALTFIAGPETLDMVMEKLKRICGHLVAPCCGEARGQLLPGSI